MNTNQTENARAQLARMMKSAPEILTPRSAARLFPVGKNNLYEAIKKGELRAFNYRGGYILSKEDLIEYILKRSVEPSPRLSGLRKRKDGEG